MDKSRNQTRLGFEPKTIHRAGVAQGSLRRALRGRGPAVTLLVLIVVVGACSMTGHTAPGTDRRPGAPRPSLATADLPPEPTANAHQILRWEKGPWWGNNPGHQPSISITQAGAETIILGASVNTQSQYLVVRDLSLAAPASEPLTLALLRTGLDHPLHVLGSCSVGTHATIRLDDASLWVDGPFSVSGALDLRRGQLTANSELRVGGKDGAPAAVHITGGTLTVTNARHDARLVMGLSGQGDVYLDGGTIEADVLQIEGTRKNRFIFNSGTLKVRSLCVTNGGPFTIGDGVHRAAQEFLGGTNVLSGPLTVNTNATLSAEGEVAISGPVINYGTIVAGRRGAHLTFASLLPPSPSAVTNWGRIYMTNGGVLTFQGTISNRVSAPITDAFTTKPGTGWTVRFNSVGGLSHTLEYKNALSEPNWKPLTSTMGTGEALELTDPAPPAEPRYYHIGVGKP
jgi:hypothetical protein